MPPQRTWTASARMYAATSSVRDLWHELFAQIGERAGIPLTIVDHAAPAPLEDLWSRVDLGCTFMCGFPYASIRNRPSLLAAAVPAPERYGGRPIYFTDLVVRRDSAFRSLENTFGGRLGWTVEHSHSGYNALRHHLAVFARDGGKLYRESSGPLLTPRRVLDAVIGGEIDVGPLDSYFHDLIRQHEPTLAGEVRTIATTAAAPFPPLVAAPDIPDDIAEVLRAALLAAGENRDLQPLLDALLLKGFAPIQPQDYDVILERARRAENAGYPVPA